jgi:uncharacterized membrane protein YdbT with pleckstrin-like domain
VGFPPKLLHPDEEIVVDVHPHWRFLAKPFLVLLVLGALLVVLGPVLAVAVPALIAVGALAGLAVLWLFVRWLSWSNEHFVVTTERLIHRKGVIGKKGMEVPLERVNNIAFNQSAMERIMGSGDLLIESGGESGQQHFRDIPRPGQMQQKIYAAMEALEDANADRMAGGRGLSPVEQLEKLHELAERGVISQEEYQAKRARLLEQM